jgi:hypothetical protein
MVERRAVPADNGWTPAHINHLAPHIADQVMNGAPVSCGWYAPTCRVRAEGMRAGPRCEWSAGR